MPDSVDDLEMDLGRLPLPRTQEASPAQQIRKALRGKHVCPFCGTTREVEVGPCTQCSLEDTPTTRSATRSKLGPWYVLQSRNPSAPGMNFATLMVLVQKGRVTARSVLRGPTTGQFWRHAAKVKGISREFGLCWNCGGEVARNARACPSCKRLQEPPLNPDVLLEAGELSGEELTEAMWADPPPASAGAFGNSTPNGGGRAQVDRLVARGGVRRELPANDVGSLPAEPSRGVLAESSADLPHGLEMAVFQIPRSDRAPSRGLFGKFVKTLGIALLLGAGGTAAMVYFDPDGTGQKIKQGWHWVRAQVTPASTPSTPTATDPRLATTPQTPAASNGAETLQLRIKAMDLVKAGREAQRRGDFGEAVKLWEQAKALGVGEDYLPLNLEASIRDARDQMK